MRQITRRDLGGLPDLADEALRRAAAQDRDELMLAGATLLADPPRRLLEIGTASGGSLWFWSQLATADAEIASIDVSHHDLHDDFEVRSEQSVLLHLGSSHDYASRQAAVAFTGLPLDFLFIDGDHSFKDVNADYDMYMPLVRRGGWIGFHDIESSYTEDGGVPKLWNYIKHAHDGYVEFVLRREGGMGIGMVRV